jgi:hypothetical protein
MTQMTPMVSHESRGGTLVPPAQAGLKIRLYVSGDLRA